MCLISSCTPKNAESANKNVKEIDIDVRNCKNPDFRKIEVIQLETSNSSLFDQVKKVKLFDNKYILIVDRHGVVSVFNTNGTFVSNSGKCIGKGPKDYRIILDVIYNKFTDQFDILAFDKSIISYDKNFCYVRKIEIQNKFKTLYDHFIATDKNSYILTPSILKDNNIIIFYNTLNEELKILGFKEPLCKLTMNNMPFTQISENLYFTPCLLTYSIYSIDTRNKLLNEKYVLNIKSDKINEDELKTYPTSMKRTDFLIFQSNYAIPMKNLIGDKYIVSLIFKKQEYYTNIYNIAKGISTTIKNTNSQPGLPFFFAIRDNVLYALVYPFELNRFKCIDKNLLDKKSQEVLNKTNDDMNPLIIKYYLK
jgi:hypothetical protein